MRASAGKLANVRLNSDRELVAQGIGKVLSLRPFSGIPATAAIARTSVALKSGAHKADRDIPCAGASCFYVYPGGL